MIAPLFVSTSGAVPLAPGNLEQKPVRGPWFWDREVLQGVFFHLVDEGQGALARCGHPLSQRQREQAPLLLMQQEK